MTHLVWDNHNIDMCGVAINWTDVFVQLLASCGLVCIWSYDYMIQQIASVIEIQFVFTASILCCKVLFVVNWAGILSDLKTVAETRPYGTAMLTVQYDPGTECQSLWNWTIWEMYT
jgi:hypothetical protein